MRYSAHAKSQMVKRRVTQSEVEAIVANPERGTYMPQAKATIEYYGFANDGRPVLVVTTRAKDCVISVIES